MENPRIELVGASRLSQDEDVRLSVVNRLVKAIHRLVSIPKFERLLPEVGSNFVFCLANAKQLIEVAGLTGRIILVRGNPQPVGEVDFGWAPYMGNVILAAHRLHSKVRSAISLRNNPVIISAFRQTGLDIVEFQLAEDQTVPDCMTLAGLQKIGYVPDVLYDNGAVGLEPLVVVFGAHPEEVVERIREVLQKLPV